MDRTLQLLKELTEAHGVPGYESEVRLVVRKYLEGLGELSADNLGSIICRTPANAPSAADLPRVMMAGHMDEIGFMVRLVTAEGYIKFVPLGGWFDQVLLGQRVVIKTRKGDVVGVIGVKPPHMLSRDERSKVVETKTMYIDIGATSADEVEAAGVRPGDPIVPRADFVELASGKTYLSKAFDDRVGVALMVSVLAELKGKTHPNEIYAAATVMEEVGLRGATTSVDVIKPDVAIVLESDIAGDVPGVTKEESLVRLGGGPSILLYDARMIPNLKLRDFVMDTAREIDIPIQTSTIEGGATDGAAIHLYHSGVPTIVLAVPARHIHSHSSIIHRDDYDNAVKLLAAMLQRLDAAKVSEFREF